MGIIEAIWDCRYYGFWMAGDTSKRYGACEDSNGELRRDVDPTTAHRNHVHFSLSWPGARMRTSYWRYAWLKQPLPDLTDPPFREPKRHQSSFRRARRRGRARDPLPEAQPVRRPELGEVADEPRSEYDEGWEYEPRY